MRLRRVTRLASRRLALAAAAVITVEGAPSAFADPIFGGPTYNATTTTGFTNQSLSLRPGSTAGNGVGVASAVKYNGGTYLGYRALKWDASGTATTELDNFGTDSLGVTNSVAYAINPAGTTVGSANRYSGGKDNGARPVRWDASGTAATELFAPASFTGSNGFAALRAVAIADSGVVIGNGNIYFSNGTSAGKSAIRWAAGSTTGLELGHISLNSTGQADDYANAVNDAGTVVGRATKYGSGGNSTLGTRAVRWNASGTAATMLDPLGADMDGYTFSEAYAINNAGRAVGYSRKFNATGTTYLGLRAVRWDASSTTAVELGNLGTNTNPPTLGQTISEAYAVNAAGTAVGVADKYSGGVNLGTRAVRWDAGTTVATELGNLGTGGKGIATSDAYAINTAGIAVGRADKYNGPTATNRAVLWGLDGAAVDLNTLLSPSDATFWTLTQAYGISDTNWVTGYGIYDSDAAGAQTGYMRTFLMQVSVPALLMGDVNRDGIVDQIDLNAVTDHWQQSNVGLALGDANQDGLVDQLDLNAVNEHWQQTAAARGSIIAVPEPTTLSLLAPAMLLLARRRRAQG